MCLSHHKQGRLIRLWNFTPLDRKPNLDLLAKEALSRQNKGLSGYVSVSGSCGSTGVGWGGGAVPRMATQKRLPGHHLHFEPGKVTGSVRAVAGSVKDVL